MHIAHAFCSLQFAVKAPAVRLPSRKTGKPARKLKRKTAPQKGQAAGAGVHSTFDSHFEVYLTFIFKERTCRNPLSNAWSSRKEKCGKEDCPHTGTTRHSTRLFRSQNARATRKLLNSCASLHHIQTKSDKATIVLALCSS